MVLVIENFLCSSKAGKENKISKKKKKKPQISDLDIPALSELFMCNKCTKTYRLRHSLTRHIKFECGKEPRYACSMCPRKFKHKYDLNVHEKGKHSEKKDQVKF
ncbi:hypothetical protein JTB14_033828 [Gonioctena quinquepunctata]|nr:hypothetical protein JTB14_033828 [Gonioctena quinquepunctata]